MTAINTEENAPDAWPLVSVIVLNYNGLRHLETCFASLLALDYPAERLELLLVDNGSSDGSAAFMAGRFPTVRVHQTGSNLGFAGGNNAGAAVARGDYFAFLNNDTKVDPAWLRELVTSLRADEAAGVVCTGSKMLGWDGQTIDFVGGVMNFHAFGWQEGYQLPVAMEPEAYHQKHDLLFACGGSMLIRADVYRTSGGFDSAFFAFFEDVDLGWRLWLMGHRVTITPSAITYHRHHGTAGAIPDHRRLVLYERNSLYAVYKNYSDANLTRVLPATLALLNARIVRFAELTGLDPAEFDLRNATPPTKDLINVHPQAVSTLLAANEFIDNLPLLTERRDAVQALRQRSDDEIFAMFGQPTRVHLLNHAVDAAYAKAHYTLLHELGIADLFAAQPKHVLLISPDVLPVGDIPASGAGIRAWALGQGLKSRGHQVRFAMPAAALAGREEQVPAEIRELAWTPETLQTLVDGLAPEVIVSCGWPNLTWLERANVPVACDFTGPHLLERDYQGYRDPSTNADEKRTAIDRADFFTCIGERQRYYFLGWLAGAGVPARDLDAALKVIPYSVSPEQPGHAWPDTWAGTDVTFVYGGIFLPWQDPSLALTTLVETLEARDSGCLHMIGGRHPFHAVDPGLFEPLIERLQSSPRVEMSGLQPHDALVVIYRRAHVAIDLMRRNPERDLAFPSRTIHYLWCGLPVIHSRHSEVAAHIAAYEAGWIVDPDDPAAIRVVIESILDNPDEARRRGENAARLAADRFAWDQTIEALDAFVRRPYIRESRGALAAHEAQRDAPARAAAAERTDGARTWDLGPLKPVVARAARQRRQPVPQLLARAKGLVRPFAGGGAARPVDVAGERRFALSELVRGHSHGQRFISPHDGLCGVELAFGTFARINSGPVVFHLRTNPGAPTDLATVTVPAYALADGQMHRFAFPPIPDSQGRWFYVMVEAPQGVPGDAVTLWARVLPPGVPGGRYEDGLPARGDLAYRLIFAEGEK